MELFMDELDSLKKDLYIDFGETQKLIATDINQIRADNTQIKMRLDILESANKIRAQESNNRSTLDKTSSARDLGSVPASPTLTPAIEKRLQEIEQFLSGLDLSVLKELDLMNKSTK